MSKKSPSNDGLFHSPPAAPQANGSTQAVLLEESREEHRGGIGGKRIVAKGELRCRALDPKTKHMAPRNETVLLRRTAIAFVIVYALSACGGGNVGASASSGGSPLSNALTPPPVPAPTAAPGNAATFHGCPVFGAGDYYNAPITNAAVDANSANYINSVWSNGGTGGFYAAPGNLGVNLADSTTPLIPVHPTGGYAFPVPYPWSPNFYISPLSDHHAVVVQTQTCHEYESWSTSYTSSTNTLSAYTGANWDLTKPYAVLPPGTYSSMASGLSFFAGMVRWEDYQSGAIRHALNFSGTYGSVTQHKYVSPASSTDQGGSTPASNDLPYGTHLRLKASFSTAGWGPQATMVANALKTYGMYLADAGSANGFYFANAPDQSNPWNGSDLGIMWSKLHITDFDILTLPPIHMKY
jgi:hypothetical protein